MAELTRVAGAAFPFRLGAWALLVVVADFLFYDHDVGWTAGLFCFLALGLAALCNPSALRRRESAVLFVLCLALCAAMVETDNALAMLLFWLFFAALFTEMRLDEAPLTWLRKLFGLGLNVGGKAVIVDNRAAHRHRRRRGAVLLPALVRGWLLPIAISTIFVLLFMHANPVIDSWLLAVDWRIPPGLIVPQRVWFWLMAGIMIWGVLRAGRVRIAARAGGRGDGRRSPLLAFLFSRAAVTRSLLIANLLFLGQNILDANFLWAGATLPAGITHAEYAHRGAYPLIVTALLAAAFVLVAMRQGGGLKDDRLIRGLIYAWLFQNLVLVASSIWRAQLYVSEYSLTYLRLAALLWMGLVLVGLVLIIVRIVQDLSSPWLIKANLFAAIALLLATCPFDMGRFIADYNVAHSQEMGGSRMIDLHYLWLIGPPAFPALQRLDERLAEYDRFNRRPLVGKMLENIDPKLNRSQAKWRSWTWRMHRLARENVLASRL